MNHVHALADSEGSIAQMRAILGQMGVVEDAIRFTLAPHREKGLNLTALQSNIHTATQALAANMRMVSTTDGLLHQLIPMPE